MVIPHAIELLYSTELTVSFTDAATTAYFRVCSLVLAGLVGLASSYGYVCTEAQGPTLNLSPTRKQIAHENR